MRHSQPLPVVPMWKAVTSLGVYCEIGPPLGFSSCACLRHLCLPPVAGVSPRYYGNWWDNHARCSCMGAAGSRLLLLGLDHMMELFSGRSLCGMQKCRVGIPGQPYLTQGNHVHWASVLASVEWGCVLTYSVDPWQTVGPEERSGVPRWWWWWWWGGGRGGGGGIICVILETQDGMLRLTEVWQQFLLMVKYEGIRGVCERLWKEVFLVSQCCSCCRQNWAAVCRMSFPGLQRPLLTWKCFYSFLFFFFFCLQDFNAQFSQTQLSI